MTKNTNSKQRCDVQYTNYLFRSLKFWISVIVICLKFGAWDLGFLIPSFLFRLNWPFFRPAAGLKPDTLNLQWPVISIENPATSFQQPAASNHSAFQIPPSFLNHSPDLFQLLIQPFCRYRDGGLKLLGKNGHFVFFHHPEVGFNGLSFIIGYRWGKLF